MYAEGVDSKFFIQVAQRPRRSMRATRCTITQAPQTAANLPQCSALSEASGEQEVHQQVCGLGVRELQCIRNRPVEHSNNSRHRLLTNTLNKSFHFTPSPASSSTGKPDFTYWSSGTLTRFAPGGIGHVCSASGTPLFAYLSTASLQDFEGVGILQARSLGYEDAAASSHGLLGYVSWSE